MKIKLTPAQWQDLKKIVAQGKRAENTLAKPIEVANEHVKIQIDADEVKITLPD